MTIGRDFEEFKRFFEVATGGKGAKIGPKNEAQTPEITSGSRRKLTRKVPKKARKWAENAHKKFLRV